MAKQVIRFNYFHVKLINNQNEMFEWDMRGFIEYIIGNKHSFDPSVILGDEISDLEWNSCGYDEFNDLYYIQLSKLRSKNIPSRKRVNQDKIPLNLADDEFLGEFNLLIFDPKLNILITQGNFYGLTTKQITMTLSNLRMKYKDAIGENDGDVPYIVSLEPIIDQTAISRVKHNNIYRSITIKGADYKEIANEDLDTQFMGTAIEALNEINGVNFEITVTMARAPKQKSLDETETRKLIDEILELRDKNIDVSMNIASRKDEENSIEYIDLIAPRLTSKIILDVQNRSTIGAEYIFNGFKEQNYFHENVHMQRTVMNILARE
ncbi:hypothetical protein D355_00330 [Enterococcus faecium SD1C-2]|uniref:DUF6731 family protein n=1 Tax=Enterococcus faecium TaxID=1352 RepID=UPI000353EDAC|nr:DUF6731 family protein [Enterococcus faecium]EPI18335.1 hypothetical protein D355_00330 [Enterococcus faecium SD1C-2]